MLSAPDFNKKQIIFVFFSEGDKLAFSNDNIVVKDADGHIKFQCTCYRLFAVYIVGNCTITSVIIQKSIRFGFFLIMLTTGFKLYQVIGAAKDGNTLLKTKQYQYSSLDIAKHITANKIANQRLTLAKVRNKSIAVTDAMAVIACHENSANNAENLNELMAYEGMASKAYFKAHFDNILWLGRQPRLKRDVVNATLDIGYTLLFGFVDALLSCYGFDTYYGVMHRQFYMRKSLVCDIVEPFRPLIDAQIKKSINLRQIQSEDFVIINHRYCLKWEKSPDYVSFLMQPIIKNKDEIFKYVQSYYRSFMKSLPANEFPVFLLEV